MKFWPADPPHVKVTNDGTRIVSGKHLRNSEKVRQTLRNLPEHIKKLPGPPPRPPRDRRPSS